MALLPMEYMGGVKSDTFSGTVASDGTIQLYQGADRIIVAIKTQGTDVSGISLYSGNNTWFAHFIKKSGSYIAYDTGNTVSGTYYYLDNI